MTFPLVQKSNDRHSFNDVTYNFRVKNKIPEIINGKV